MGNGTVIWLLGLRVKRNPFSVYILNLAIADIAFLCSLSVVVMLVLLRSNVESFLGLLVPPFFTFTMAGLSLLMAISTERCLSVTFPIWYSLTLLICVQCCSRQRQVTKLYRVTLLTALAFLVLGEPLRLSFLLKTLSYWSGNFMYFFYASWFLAALNSAVNPVIYFFVGRQGQWPGRRALRELLQSALTEDTS
ncbi:mas-related G-protein coupled receptor member X2-like [Rhynchonycteris naso]